MSEQEQEVESLFEGVGPRPEPPAEVRERVFAAVQREWRQHKRRRWRLPVALAATAVLAMTAALLLTRVAPTVELRVGDTQGVWIDGTYFGASSGVLMLDAGAVVEADGSTRLIAGHAIEVRLREGTRLRWVEPNAIRLERGSVYVDTDGRGHLQVRTALGVVSDVGTTFMVTLADDVLEVAMRAGMAAIDTEHGRYTATAGAYQGDVVRVDGQRISARAEPASDGRWAWIHAVHPGYAERDVKPLLEAIADDLGLELTFASAAVQAAALQGRLQGDLGGLGPDQALEAVLATTGLARREAEGAALLIEFQSGAD